MSTHAIPAVDLDTLSRKLERDLRRASGLIYGNGPNAAPTALEFTPDLSAPEQTTLTQILAASGKSFDLLPAEYQAVKDEVTTLATYLGTATPTAAQSATALKALIRVVRALVRE